MPKIVNSTDEEIYTDYLIAKVRGNKVNTVHKKHNCSRKYVDIVVKRMQSTEEHKLEKSLRPYEWEEKYKHIKDKLDSKKKWTKEDYELQDALIRHLYRICLFDISEIVEYMNTETETVKEILCG